MLTKILNILGGVDGVFGEGRRGDGFLYSWDDTLYTRSLCEPHVWDDGRMVGQVYLVYLEFKTCI